MQEYLIWDFMLGLYLYLVHITGSDARKGSMGDFNCLVRWNLLGKPLKGLEPAANFRGQPA